MTTLDTLKPRPASISPLLDADNKPISTPVKKIIQKPAKPKNQTYTLYLPTDLIEQIRLIANQNDVPINQVVIQALQAFIS